MRKVLNLMILVFGLHFVSRSNATDYPFTYPVRTSNYNGWDTAVRGDIGTVGMGGATVALPHSISAAESNPAGFAMTTSGLSVQINSNTIHDNEIQRGGAPYDSNQWGVGVSPSPWGFGLAYYAPKTESGSYISPNTGRANDTEVSVKEVHLSVARAFFRNKLAIGISGGLYKGIRTLGNYPYEASSYGFQFGALYRLPDHLILGAMFAPQTVIDPSTDQDQGELPGFNKAIIIPSRSAVGLGWMPNRFFKAGFGLHYVAGVANTALLADQSKSLGKNATLSPRVGASYVIGDFKNFKIEYAMGSYYEPSRVSGERNRLHGTVGLEMNPWFINTGAGCDLAIGYRNVMVSVGIDIVRTLRTLDILPRERVPYYNSFFPPPFKVSPDGLPEGMTTDDRKGIGSPSVKDVGNIIQDASRRIEEKIHSQYEPSPEEESATPQDQSNTKRKKKRVVIDFSKQW